MQYCSSGVGKSSVGCPLRTGREARASSVCFLNTSVTQPEGMRGTFVMGVGQESVPFLSSVFSSSESSFFILSCSNRLYHPVLQAWLFLKHVSMWPQRSLPSSNNSCLYVISWVTSHKFMKPDWSLLKGDITSLENVVSSHSAENPSVSSSGHCWPAFFVCSSFLGRTFLGVILDSLRLVVVFIIYCNTCTNWRFVKLLLCLNGWKVCDYIMVTLLGC